MSNQKNSPEQLTLPFFGEELVASSAQVFFLNSYRHPSKVEAPLDASIPKEEERKIIDRVLERAERLSWYK